MKTLSVLFAGVAILFISSCDFEGKVSGSYYVTAGANSHSSNMNWDTTYGTGIIKIEKTGPNKLRFIDNAILNRNFELSYNESLSSQSDVAYYGDPTGPRFIKFNRTNDNIEVGDDVFVHTSGSEGTYWTGKKVQ